MGAERFFLLSREDKTGGQILYSAAAAGTGKQLTLKTHRNPFATCARFLNRFFSKKGAPL